VRFTDLTQSVEEFIERLIAPTATA
jgi:hypothetical protein